MLIKATKSKIVDGVAFDLKPADDLIIQAGVRVQSMTTDVVQGDGANQSVTVAGTIFGGNPGSGIVLSGAKALVTITATGHVATPGGVGVYFAGANPTLVNNGLIIGWYGVHTTADFSGTFNLTNRGTIIGNNDAVWSSTEVGEKTVFKNFGFVRGDMLSNGGKAYVGGEGVDVVVNAGEIQGQIQLVGGNDIYNGLKGILFWGDVWAGEGNDTLMAGASHEVLHGEGRDDTLDFRGAGAVTVDLLDGSLNKGVAKGDVYDGFETLNGSNTGGDVILGDHTSMLLRGFGGADRIEARNGDDTVNGGAGKDVLSGGEGVDVFVFGASTEGGDKILDFNADQDWVQINVKGFGGGLVAGSLADAAFVSGTTNAAGDAGDRFILNTTNTTLWFDKDGTGTKFKPVLVADLQAGATLTAADFVLA